MVEKRLKTHSDSEDFTLIRPKTRSQMRSYNNLVSEPSSMKELRRLQQQFEACMVMYKEDWTQLEARQEQIAMKLTILTRETNEQHMETRPDEIRGNLRQGSSECQGKGRITPKISRLDFPKYDGSNDPLGWLNHCEHIFKHQKIVEEEKVELAAFHMDGDAQLGFLKLKRDKPELSWEEFKSLCNL